MNRIETDLLGEKVGRCQTGPEMSPTYTLKMNFYGAPCAPRRTDIEMVKEDDGTVSIVIDACLYNSLQPTV